MEHFLQLARLKAETEENGQRQEAAKAVLNAAKTAKREGRRLSEQEISSIEDPILRTTTAAEVLPLLKETLLQFSSFTDLQCLTLFLEKEVDLCKL